MNFDFALILVVVTLVTGALWLVDLLFFAGARKRKQQRLIEENVESPEVARPYWSEFSASVFPVLAAVLVLRSFLYEPFQIPSGSMLPTLEVGDFILVNKYHYGLRTPVGNVKLVENNDPKRGDVAVFKYPQNPKIYYIKRVVGLPGDEIVYQDKVLYVNGVPQEQTLIAQMPAVNPKRLWVNENLSDTDHEMYRDVNARARNGQWRVPQGHYFMMGDNRDNSNDSRYWGFVPDELIVGKAVSVWMHWAEFLSVPDFTAIRSIQ